MLTTTVNSSSEVQAQVPASSLATADTATVAVVNPAPGGGKSNELSFVVKSITTNVSVLDVEGNDLAWDTQRQLIYVSVPSTATNNANTITIVNPVAGQIVRSQATNPEPGVLSLSDDGQFLYAVIGGDSAVQRFTMPALTPDIKWTVGSDPIFGTYVPTDVEAMPGAPHTVAVVRGLPLSTRSAGGVVIYDDGVARPTSVCGLGSFCDSLKWKSDGSELFAEDNSSSTRFFYRLGVNAAGLNVLQESGGVFRAWGTNLHLDPQTNYVYTDSGETVDAKKGLPVGNYAAGPVGRPAYSGVLAAIDSGLKRIFFVAPVQDQSGHPSFQIQVFDQTEFKLLGSFLIGAAVGTPVDFIRWGQSGLAFVTNDIARGNASVGKLYIIDGPLVNPSGVTDSSTGTALSPVPTLTSMSPISAAVGSGTTTVTITGRDFAGQPTVMWSDTPVSADVPSSDMTTAGLASVTVSNPGPGGGNSNVLTFSVEPPPTSGNQIAVFPTGGTTWYGIRRHRRFT